MYRNSFNPLNNFNPTLNPGPRIALNQPQTLRLTEPLAKTYLTRLSVNYGINAERFEAALGGQTSVNTLFTELPEFKIPADRKQAQQTVKVIIDKAGVQHITAYLTDRGITVNTVPQPVIDRFNRYLAKRFDPQNTNDPLALAKALSEQDPYIAKSMPALVSAWLTDSAVYSTVVSQVTAAGPHQSSDAKSIDILDRVSVLTSKLNATAESFKMGGIQISEGQKLLQEIQGLSSNDVNAAQVSPNNERRSAVGSEVSQYYQAVENFRNTLYDRRGYLDQKLTDPGLSDAERQSFKTERNAIEGFLADFDPATTGDASIALTVMHTSAQQSAAAQVSIDSTQKFSQLDAKQQETVTDSQNKQMVDLTTFVKMARQEPESFKRYATREIKANTAIGQFIKKLLLQGGLKEDQIATTDAKRLVDALSVGAGRQVGANINDLQKKFDIISRLDSKLIAKFVDAVAPELAFLLKGESDGESRGGGGFAGLNKFQSYTPTQSAYVPVSYSLAQKSVFFAVLAHWDGWLLTKSPNDFAKDMAAIAGQSRDFQAAVEKMKKQYEADIAKAQNHNMREAAQAVTRALDSALVQLAGVSNKSMTGNTKESTRDGQQVAYEVTSFFAEDSAKREARMIGIEWDSRNKAA